MVEYVVFALIAVAAVVLVTARGTRSQRQKTASASVPVPSDRDRYGFPIPEGDDLVDTVPAAAWPARRVDGGRLDRSR